MGASRIGFNLFRKAGWRNLRFAIKNKRSIKHLWADTFIQIWCWIVKHEIYNSGIDNDPPEWAYKRCHQYIRAKK